MMGRARANCQSSENVWKTTGHFRGVTGHQHHRRMRSPEPDLAVSATVFLCKSSLRTLRNGGDTGSKREEMGEFVIPNDLELHRLTGAYATVALAPASRGQCRERTCSAKSINNLYSDFFLPFSAIIRKSSGVFSVAIFGRIFFVSIISLFKRSPTAFERFLLCVFMFNGTSIFTCTSQFRLSVVFS